MGAMLWVLLATGARAFRSPAEGLSIRRPSRQVVTPRGAVNGALASPARQLFDRFDDYKEASRAFRRTVYGAENWRKHRSTKRYFRAILTAIQSGVLRGLALELVLLGIVAGTVAGLSAAGIATLGIPALPLTLTAPAVGLLITFRTNQAYGRWWEARKIWGAVINKTRDMTRQAHWFRDTDRARRFSALAVAFGYALNAHCLKGTLQNPSDHIAPHATVDDKLQSELTSLIGPENTKEVLAAPHRPVEVCRLLTRCVAEEGLTPQMEARVDENIATFSDFGGMCDRIQKTPMPLVYTRLTARFLFCWLFFVPSALLSAGLGTAPIVLGSMAIATLMFGIDELGVQIEEPFSVLPMDSYCDGLRALHNYAEFLPAPIAERKEKVWV
ncbi:hypothetical protein CTAYLR_009894 [Chrysophaeum taylorii]|uniref:Uncharacterized protein n=1 Tax=Chrysophaeum taylorii TaxID=2483200 RepID=A0AAD7UHR1_9STRA|nr:hypothetical protein CTAYLR_009894 [Chrysophaeum taylorii]